MTLIGIMHRTLESIMRDVSFQYSAVYLILGDGAGRVLLARRFNTGFMDGFYSLPAGHIEPGESVTAALVRETREEIGLTLNLAQCRFVHVQHRRNPDRVYYDFYFASNQWDGEPRICEPHKCDDLRWFALNALPANTVPYVQDILTRLLPAGQMYSESGFCPPPAGRG